MIPQTKAGAPHSRFTLSPGMVKCSRRPLVISTVLGSCVAVCLFDERQRIGGMNHFIMPRQAPKSIRDSRYGDGAMDALFAWFRRQGSRTEDLRAKIFGGARALWDNASTFSVGADNIAVAELGLQSRGIPLLAQRVGGNDGLVIHMESWSGVVLVQKIAKPEVVSLSRSEPARRQ